MSDHSSDFVAPAWRFLDPAADTTTHGGTKAKADFRVIARDAGLVGLPLGGRSRGERIANILGIARFAALAPRTTILAHFPTYHGSGQLALRMLAARHRIVYLVHDIDQERGVSPTQPLSAFDRATGFIVSGQLDRLPGTDRMKGRAVHLRMWDYLADPAVPPAPHNDRILFAGSLSPSKSPWLHDRSRTTPLLIAGGGGDSEFPVPGDVFLGAFSPEDFEFARSAGWGLIWDGDSASDLSGPTGLYQRFNQPSKLSLYLAAGLPLLCHHDAAVAGLIREEGLGLTIGSVDEASAVIAALSIDQRRTIHANVRRVREAVVRGDHMRAAIAALRQMPLLNA